MPGTSSGSRTTYRARRFLVPASVMSSPEPSSRCTRAAIGDLLLGLGGSVGTSSRQRTQPPAGQVHHQVQPGGADVDELAVPGDVVDEAARQRGQRRVEGLQRAERGDVDAGDGRPSSRPRRSSARPSTSGSSGTRTSLGATPDQAAASRDARHTGRHAPGHAAPGRGRGLPRRPRSGRALRVSWHAEADVVVLSLWAGGTCSGIVPAARRGRPGPHRGAARRPGAVATTRTAPADRADAVTPRADLRPGHSPG